MEIKIGQRKYKVTNVLDPRGIDNQPCSGTINESTEELHLRTSNDLMTNAETFIHETIHGLDFFLGLDLSEEEVLKLGALLATVIIDNTHIMDMTFFDIDRLSKVSNTYNNLRVNQLKVGWHTFDIVWKSEIFNDDNVLCYNRVDFINSKIIITSDLSEGQSVASLYFSILVILVEQFGIEMSVENRSRLSQGLAMVIMDNPSVFNLIWRS